MPEDFRHSLLIQRKPLPSKAGSDEAEQDNKQESKPEKKAEEPAKKEDSKSGLTLEQLMKADIGMLSDEDLEKGIKVAAEAEEYKLASRLRDELKGRKEGGSNV